MHFYKVHQGCEAAQEFLSDTQAGAKEDLCSSFLKGLCYTAPMYFASSVPRPRGEWLDTLSKWIRSIDQGIIVELIMDKEAG